jgi:hypothetical protein
MEGEGREGKGEERGGGKEGEGRVNTSTEFKIEPMVA